MIQKEILARSAELDLILERTRAEDFTVDNGPGRPTTEVARDVLTRAAWL